MLVLLVEPHDDTRALYGEYLRLSAWDTEEAVDGREALAKALRTRPNAIVTETRLPGMDGLALCRVVRADPTIADTRIVVVSAVATDTAVQRAHSAGADAVLAKPCSPTDLSRVLADLLAASGATSAMMRDSTRELRASVERSRQVLDAAERSVRRAGTPPRKATLAVPLLVTRTDLECPQCARPLTYVRSFVGGVPSTREQWDYFECPGSCGEYQYRVRTRRLRRVT